MKSEIVKTKNGGDVSVKIYETLNEAITELKNEGVLKAVNRMTRTDTINKANTKQSLSARVNAAVKAGKLSKGSLESLLLRIDAKGIQKVNKEEPKK